MTKGFRLFNVKIIDHDHDLVCYNFDFYSTMIYQSMICSYVLEMSF